MNMIYFILIPMLLAALAAVLLPERRAFHAAVIGSAVSLGLSLFFLFDYFNKPFLESVNWFVSGGFTFSISFSASNLTLFMASLVSFISLLVLVFSNFYMKKEPQRRYYAEMSLFVFSMLGLVMSNSLLLFYVFWELIGVMSYLLIGFWYQKEAPAAAGKKALIFTRIGDLSFFAAVIILFSSAKTLSITGILSSIGSLNHGALIASASLLFIAIISKSAQFPFYTWLVDAMEGPTPVSALLHSATMVAAGAYLLVLMLPLFLSAGFASMIITFGFVTAFIAALLGLKETHLKRILAYSTIESLSFMFIAAATANAGGAIFYLFTHAIFKSLLFFIAGAGFILFGSYDIYKLKSSVKNSGWLYVPALIGFASIAGLPPFMSFFAHLSLSANFTTLDSVVFVLLSFITALFSFRAFFVAFKKTAAPRLKLELSVYVPVLLLSAIALFGGVIMFYFTGIIHTVYYVDIFSMVSMLAAFAGAYTAFELFLNRRLLRQVSAAKNAAIKLSERSFDSIITAFGIAFVSFADIVGRLDEKFISLFSWISNYFMSLGLASKEIQNGDSSTYIAAIFLGLVIVIIIAVMFV